MELSSRYPALSFALAIHPFVPFEPFLEADGFENGRCGDLYLYTPGEVGEEIEIWRSKLDLEEVEILYIYGIGLGHYAKALQPWLDSLHTRAIVFLEDDLAPIAATLASVRGSKLLDNPQVHICYRPPEQSWSSFLEQVAHAFPADRIAVAALEAYKRRFPRRLSQIRLGLMRHSTYVQAALSEILHADRLFENLVSNFRRLPTSFYANRLRGSFTGVPSMICGAGPSLAAAIPLLRQLQERALLIAGGSAITALSTQGVEPHLALAVDPNPEEYDRLKESAPLHAPFLYASRLYPSVFDICKGPIGYLSSATGGACEVWMEQKLQLSELPIGPELGKEAMSITTLAIAYAEALGCNPIILVGVDLAYTDLKRYAPGVIVDPRIEIAKLQRASRANERLVRRKGKRGERLYTLVRWVMEAASIGAYAKSHRRTLFLNATAGGLPILGVADLPLEQVLERYCQRPHDLRKRLHAAIGKNPIAVTAGQVEEAFSELQASLKRLLVICRAMCDEIEQAPQLPTGRMALLESDVEEELAFQVLFSSLFYALDQLLERTYPSSFAALQRQRLKDKWTHLCTLVQSKMSVLQTL